MRDQGACRSTAAQSRSGGRIEIVKSYLGLFARRLRTTNSERLGHSDQIGQRPRTHFLHDVSTVDLHGNLSKTNLGCYLFVHEAGSDQSQNLPLAGGQGLKKGLQVRDDLADFAPLPVPFNRRHHRIQHVLIAKRLGQEIDSSALHGPDGHRNIAMAGHEDDWNVNVRLGQLALKIQAVFSGQPDANPTPAGDLTSSTRQLATSGGLLCSISDAEPNTSTSNPTD